MKKIYVIAALALATMPLAAQETYENAKIAAEDLNGTARYVGMGGAMEALGADISTISSNPAGIGLFRKSNVSASMGLVIQGGSVGNTLGGSTTNVSFDQAGFVISRRTSRTSFLNLAFNFHKSRNFDYILSASNSLNNNASQNKQTAWKGVEGWLYKEKKETTTGGEEIYVPDFSAPYYTCNQIDELYANKLYDKENGWVYYNAKDFTFNRNHEGYIGVYDFNVSGNINDRVYLGLTFGLHDVHYKHNGCYSETFDPSIGSPFDKHVSQMSIVESREITGTGFDVKGGIIIRPVEESPFRFGLSVATPTFYTLTTSSYVYASKDDAAVSKNKYSEVDGRYKFKLYTPWKFGASLGHTFGSDLALGLSYEYADYSTIDTRYIENGYYDYWNDAYYDRSSSDKVMNQHTKQTLKGVHTLKVGAEFKPIPNLSLRAGYNYVSPMYKKSGYKDGTLDTDGSYCSSATDYTNWDETHRATCGVGYSIDGFNVSLAYQFSTTNGTFHPFTNNADYETVAPDTKVSNKRHQLLLTLGYSF